MTDKKFDDEIIKGLKRMSEEDPNGFSADILDLINRQKSEIESLKIEFSAMRDTANLYKAKNEKLRAKVETRTQEKLALGRVYTQKLKTAKSEARKEFAKKITDILLKEMVGEE